MARIDRLASALVALAAFALAWHHMTIVGDGFWTIASGRWLLAHGVPHEDPFAYASVGHWTLVSSGACALFAAITDLLGPRGLMAVCAAVEAFAVWLLWSRAARTSLARACLLPAALLFIQIDSEDLSARGQIFGDLGFVLILGVVARAWHGRRTHPALVAALAIAWTNLHLSFVAATVVPLAAAVAASLATETRRAIRPCLVAAAIAAVSALVTPYGPRYLPLALGTAFDPSTTSLDLFRSPDFHDPMWLLAPATAIALAVVLVRRARIGEAAFLLLFVLAACKSRRFATPLIAVEIMLAGPLLDELSPRRWMAAATASVAGVFGVALLLVEGWRKDPFRDVPVAAAEVAHREPGHVVIPLHWGGYLAYAWMGSPRYFIDGRDHLDLFGNGAFDDSNALWSAAPDAPAVLDIYEANVVIWERDHPLDVDYLRRSPNWRLVHEDAIAVVFVRTHPLR